MMDVLSIHQFMKDSEQAMKGNERIQQAGMGQ